MLHLARELLVHAVKPAEIIFGVFQETMKEDPTNPENKSVLSFECDGCGQFFESWERLRQHAIDCRDDDSEEQ
jgi:hypothetical protein